MRRNGAHAGDLFSAVAVQGDNRLVLRLTGECDLSNADELGRQIREAGEVAKRIVVDLAALEFIDSSCLKVLISAMDTARLNGRAITLRKGDEKVMRIFEISGLDETLPFE